MTRNPLLNKTTATRENALTAEEREVFLALKLDCHLGTNRGDGWWHVTPMWYLWEDGHFSLTLGASRRHLADMRRDPHVSVCVDVDPRLAEGLQAGTKSVVCFGLAELTELHEDEAFVRDTTWRIMARYIGPEAPRYHEAIWAEDRTIATVSPQRWLTWDQTKG